MMGQHFSSADSFHSCDLLDGLKPSGIGRDYLGFTGKLNEDRRLCLIFRACTLSDQNETILFNLRKSTGWFETHIFLEI